MKYLIRQILAQGRVALHLSNIYGIELTANQAVLGVKESRMIYSGLHGTKEETTKAFKTWADRPLLTWGTRNNAPHIAATIRELTGRGEPLGDVTLVIMLNPIPWMR